MWADHLMLRNILSSHIVVLQDFTWTTTSHRSVITLLLHQNSGEIAFIFVKKKKKNCTGNAAAVALQRSCTAEIVTEMAHPVQRVKPRVSVVFHSLIEHNRRKQTDCVYTVALLPRRPCRCDITHAAHSADLELLLIVNWVPVAIHWSPTSLATMTFDPWHRQGILLRATVVQRVCLFFLSLCGCHPSVWLA